MSSAAKPRDERKPTGCLSYFHGHPFAEGLAVERLPNLWPILARPLCSEVFHGDQLTGHERPPPGDANAAQPGLGGDAVLMLTKDGLQLRGGSSEICRTRSDDRGHGFCRITSALG